MELPPWSKFQKLCLDFESLSRNKSTAFRGYDDLLTYADEASLKIFPEPLHSVLLYVYMSGEEPHLRRYSRVKEFLEQLRTKQEKHYEYVRSPLNKILEQIGYSSFVLQLEEDRERVKRIHDILLTKDSELTVRIRELKDHREMRPDKTMEDLDVASMHANLSNAINITGEAFGSIYRMLRKLQTEGPDMRNKDLLKAADRHGDLLRAEGQGNQLKLKLGDTIVDTIESNNLAELSQSDRDALNHYEQNMLVNQDKILAIEKAISTAVDAEMISSYKSRIQRITKDLCREFAKINKILATLKIEPATLKQYVSNITVTCEENERSRVE